MLSVGIIGLPNAGKSTLFNALVAKPKAGVGKYPFTTIDKNIGVVEVPDSTLLDLAKIENIEKVTPTTITFVDIAGLIKGAHLGEGLGNQFLHHIREVDIILHVLRFFKNDGVAHVHAKIDPQEDLAVVNEELLFADLQTLEKRLKRPASAEATAGEEKILLKKFIDKLNQGIPAYNVPVNEKELEFIKSLNLLTLKKQLLIANIGEEDIGKEPKKLNHQPIIAISAKLESELSEMPWVEQQRFLKEYGLKKSAKEQIIVNAYQALEMITFYTIVKRKEAKAWPIKKGTTAVEAAGKIHTDFAKHFVKVEAINALSLLQIGSWHKAHETGKIALHGKEYLVQNQDVVEFKISSG